MTNQKTVVRGETVILDYKTLSDTRYENCRLVYRGGRPPSLVNNDFIDCEWLFENEAANTVAFLKALYTGGAQGLILATLGIRQDGQ